MKFIKPFAALRANPKNVAEVVAPPYDVVNTAEAKDLAKDNPLSFLHVSKPEIDLPEGTNPYDVSVYAKGAENFNQFRKQGVLQQDKQESYYIYQIEMGEHKQTGIVVAASVTAYQTNHIRKHEKTRPEKEDDRVRLTDALQAQCSPVLLTYQHDQPLEVLIKRLIIQKPLYDVVAHDGIAHRLWQVNTPENVEQITMLFNSMPALYIADGHHRSAAASRIANLYNQQHRNPEANYNYFLGVLFPHNEMRILGYHRIIKDLNGLSAKDFLKQLAKNFSVTLATKAVEPQQTQTLGIYLAGQWYLVKPLKPINNKDPIASLDVSLLHDKIIEPLLGISDPRNDKRIDFIGGSRGLSALEQAVDSGEAAIAFSLFPTSINQLMYVADNQQVMPPKSTWFEPKLADGLVALLF